MISDELVRADDTSISLHPFEVPAFIENELANSYEILQSSLPFFRTFRSLEHVSCYLAQRDGHRSTVLLFVCRKRRIDVLNEMIEIAEAEVERFAAHVFEHFNNVDVITFKALKTTTSRFRFPVQKYGSKETYVIALPATPEDYTSSLGKSTRANIRQQTNGVQRHFPSFASKFFENEEITEEHIRQIIAFSEKKINAKGIRFSHDAERIIALARSCGFVNIFLIDGRVCAGSINYRVGTSYFGEVTGYDPEYEKYGLGKLCVHQTICESISRGGKRFYLGGGVFDFKQRLLGAVVGMDELHIYRSYPRMLANAGTAARALAAAYVRRLKKVLHQHKQEKWAKAVFKSVYFFRNRAKN